VDKKTVLQVIERLRQHYLKLLVEETDREKMFHYAFALSVLSKVYIDVVRGDIPIEVKE